MHQDRQIRVRGERKREPDVRKLSRALLALAMAEARAEQEAQAQLQEQEQDPQERRAGDSKPNDPPRRSA